LVSHVDEGLVRCTYLLGIPQQSVNKLTDEYDSVNIESCGVPCDVKHRTDTSTPEEPFQIAGLQ
jgi:hypothetical protein